jgi:hypothetical protein
MPVRVACGQPRSFVTESRTVRPVATTVATKPGASLEHRNFRGSLLRRVAGGDVIDCLEAARQGLRPSVYQEAVARHGVCIQS